LSFKIKQNLDVPNDGHLSH